MDALSPGFWKSLDRLVATCPLVIDRPKGFHHPRYHEAIYPVDYGYLEGTTAGDGAGIDAWLGTGDRWALDAIALTVDLHKRDIEIKLLLGCNEHEKQLIVNFMNNNIMQATLILRTPPGECHE